MSVYKRAIMNYLNKNKTIVELCGGTYGENHAGSLFYPFEFIPEAIQESFCAVAFDVGASVSLTNETFTNLSLYFFVMCHKDLIISEDLSGLRYDMIAQEIIRDFAGDNVLGIGQVKFGMNEPYITMRLIRGRALSFSVYDVSPETYNKHAESFI